MRLLFMKIGKFYIRVEENIGIIGTYKQRSVSCQLERGAVASGIIK